MNQAQGPIDITIDLPQVEARLDEFESVLGPELTRQLRCLLAWCSTMLGLLNAKDATIASLRRLVFGPRSERTRDVLPPSAPQPAPVPKDDAAPRNDAATAAASAAPTEKDAGTNTPSAPPRRKGHGRTAASDYTGCTPVVVEHPSHCAGGDCPHCAQGTLYRQPDWALHVRLFGHPPVTGFRYELERLRCGLCGRLETAPLPEAAGQKKYDASVPAVLAVLRYGEGLPWTRLARMQQAYGVPLAAATQWELVRDSLEQGPRQVHVQLLGLAAQGDVLHNDDTRGRILELKAKRARGERLRDDAPDRIGVNTSVVLSAAEGRPTIALFFTGPRHAGERLGAVLGRRDPALSPPIQMCDASDQNTSHGLLTVLAHCMSHGRRKFVELASLHGPEVAFVLEKLARVYRADHLAKRFGLSPEKRLLLHQRRSAPALEALRKWMEQQLQDRQVEPNSRLGKAIGYMQRRWETLTTFLRVAGAPLDNNLAERALKMAIRHRKNSLQYKTQKGAEVGDIYMSLIHTCRLCGADPFHYLASLMRNEERVEEHPTRWLPWNYREQLDGPAPAHPASTEAAAIGAG